MKTNLNTKAIIKVLGKLVLAESFMMLLPLTICLINGESDWSAFLTGSVAALFAGSAAVYFTRHATTVLHLREGFIITALIWAFYGLFGAIPLMLCQLPIGFTDAIFETISGFTTTGASVMPDVGTESHGILFWRALTQWIGGLGIILFMLALLPELNKSTGISMFNAESSGITHDKLHPRIRQTALSLWAIYVAVTLVSIALLWAGPMSLFDSVCQTFAAISTGGFTTHSNGMSYWHSNYVLGVLSVVMFIGSVNFMVLYATWRNGYKEICHNEVTRAFASIILVAYLLLVMSAIIDGETFSIDRYLFYPLFHVVSAVSSTGFTITEAESWGSFSLFLTILLMLSGSCAGSTSGGIKVDRLIVMGRNLSNEIKKSVFPKRTYVVNLNGSFLRNSLVSRVSAFVTLYILLVLISTAVVTLNGYSFSDSLFMVSSCIGCNGLGYGATGVEGSYAALPCLVKWILTLLMLIGRLELFTFIVLFLPSFWKR